MTGIKTKNIYLSISIGSNKYPKIKGKQYEKKIKIILNVKIFSSLKILSLNFIIIKINDNKYIDPKILDPKNVEKKKFV